MARCTECQTEWTFKDKVKMFKGLSKSTECPYCGEEQFINIKAQRQMGLANMIIPLAMFIPFLIPLDVPISIHIPFIIIVIAAVVVLNISLIKLSRKEEFPI